MIKKLKIRFIVTAMASVIVVLSIITLVVNLLNFASVRDFADDLLTVLANNGGVFSSRFSPDKPYGFDDEDAEKESFKDIGFSEETPHETRYFSVIFERDAIITVNTEKISAISDEKAVQLALEVKKSDNKRGYIGNLRYLSAENGSLVVFVDCTRQLATANSFLKTSILVCVLGVLGVFVLIVAFSGKAVAPIAESYERQKRFITDAGHELKTPLTVISANNELTELSSGETENTRAIARQVDKMNHMVKNMTLLAKIGEQKPTNAKNFSLSDTLNDMIESFIAALSACGRAFESDIDDVTFFGDEDLIRRAISVLLENSCKYALTFTKVSLKKDGKNAVLTVSNDAQGVPDGNLNRCFERFYRSESARGSAVDGSGIGLSIASEIVKLYKGSVSAYGENGVFTVKFVMPSLKR